MKTYINKVVTILGPDRGPFHAEVRLCPRRGPLLMEIAARLAGDHICDLILHSNSTDLYQIMLEAYLNKPVTRPSKNIAKKHVGIRFFIRPKLDQYKRLEGMDDLKKMEGLLDIEIYFGPNSVIPGRDNCLGRLGHIILEGHDAETLLANLEKADKSLHFF